MNVTLQCFGGRPNGQIHVFWACHLFGSILRICSLRLNNCFFLCCFFKFITFVLLATSLLCWSNQEVRSLSHEAHTCIKLMAVCCSWVRIFSTWNYKLEELFLVFLQNKHTHKERNKGIINVFTPYGWCLFFDNETKPKNICFSYRTWFVICLK